MLCWHFQPNRPANCLGVLPVGEDVADDVDPARGLGRELLLEIGNGLEGRTGYGVDQPEAEQRRRPPPGDDRRRTARNGRGLRDDFSDEVDAVEEADPLGVDERTTVLGERIEDAVGDRPVSRLKRGTPATSGRRACGRPRRRCC